MRRFLTLALAFVALAASVQAQAATAEGDPPKRGLLVNKPEAFQGYTLIAPLGATTVYLVDMEGQVVHRWDTEYAPGSEYFLDNGNLLRCVRQPDVERFEGGGQCGRIQELDWDGNVVWDYEFFSDDFLQHHDIAPTPDGTILFISWEYKTPKEALDAGRHPSMISKKAGMWPDFVAEVEPIGPTEGEIIWEWHVWDHLIQDLDPERANYGDVREHPERVDINADAEHLRLTDDQIEDLKALGYIANTPSPDQLSADWLHTNGIDYNPDLDQIALSVPKMNEIWIIDHSTTISEAATSEGGNSGKGGDLLYRWGNPQNYRQGQPLDRKLFYQHHASWVPEGYPGEGHLTVFNNGGGRPGVPEPENWSAVLELKLPLNGDTTYDREPDMPYGPETPHWEYSDNPTFFSGFISGTQRLPNGHTMINQGAAGRVFEVTPDGDIVWDFQHELGKDAIAKEGQPAPMEALFRATRIPADHPGLRGKDLRPLADR